MNRFITKFDLELQKIIVNTEAINIDLMTKAHGINEYFDKMPFTKKAVENESIFGIRVLFFSKRYHLTPYLLVVNSPVLTQKLLQS